MRLHLLPLVAAASLGPAAVAAQDQRPASPPGIAARTEGMDRRDGFLPVILDRKKGAILLELPADSTRALMCLTLATGLGSNPVGIDRGENGPCQVARFERAGERVLVVLENWGYRSSTGSPDHVRSVHESFAPSTVAALPLQAEEGGRLLVDASDLFFRDWLDVGPRVADAGQGSYALARDRSTADAAHTRGYAANTEVDVALTWVTSGKPGPIPQRVLPDPRAFTLRQHVTLARLPEGYRPRALDPRMGFFGITFKDYAQPVSGALEQRWINRHRLERADPANPASPITNPIVYYIDRGIPEPILGATIAGARFWEEAFHRAGLAGGFRVELLPEGADPMDIRYNVVQWENRNERGWSIGGSLDDPRTGQILKAMARMDSHRARTSFNLFAALKGANTPGDTAFVLGRVRQVTAHEIGHTLGMSHNYIASTYDRGSVMDYPAPRARLGADGQVDLSQAYDLGPGAFDVLAIRWAYGIFPPGTEQDSLAAIVQEGLRQGLLFLSDADARPDFASDPRVNLWDDAATAADFLDHQMAVRRVAMGRFGLGNLRPGEPVATLQERFAPLYFFHRFAVGAVAKALGGMEYHNAVAGDGQQASRPVATPAQRAALARLLGTLDPAALAIPDTVVTLLAPRPYGYEPTVELFGSRTRPGFDEFEAARTLADMILTAVLQRDRAARLLHAEARAAGALGLGEVIDSLVASTWAQPATPVRKHLAIRRVTQRALVDRLLALAADKEAAPEVRALANLKLADLAGRADARAAAARGDVDRAHWRAIATDIRHWGTERELPPTTAALRPPPGDPFGAECDW